MRWSPGQVIITPCGDLDALHAPALERSIASGSDGINVLLDLGAVGFLDAACLGVIATMAARLREAGDALVLRSPRPLARRLLEVNELDSLVEPGEPTAHGEPWAGSSEDGTDPPGTDRQAIAPAAAARSIADGLLGASLRLAAAYAQNAIAGADGASVALIRRGRLATIAASDETIAQMDRNQYATGEGPCMSAASNGQMFHVAEVSADPRWPNFLRRAEADGIGSILSAPLLVESHPVGSLNVYARAVRAFDRDDQSTAAAIASQAAVVAAESQDDATDARLADALESRSIIAQAQGVLMARYGVSSETAFAAMCRSSRSAGVPIKRRAAHIVAATNRDGLIGEVVA